MIIARSSSTIRKTSSDTVDGVRLNLDELFRSVDGAHRTLRHAPHRLVIQLRKPVAHEDLSELGAFVFLKVRTPEQIIEWHIF